MNESEQFQRKFCRPTKLSKKHKAMREPKRAVKPRASRLAGSARGRASRIGEAESKATNKISWANKATVYKHDKHSKFSDKRAGNSQKNQRGAQYSNKRSSFGARRIARDI